MTVARREGLKVFPPASLFDPLHADPRWPHFSVRFEHLNGSPELQDAAAVSFGERLPLLEGDAPFDGRWQVGISGAAYALFDKGSKSEDLINTDYRWFIPLSYRSGPFSALFRYYHQSSHLGDELILRGKPITRVNLSYEAVDLTLSQDIGKRYRVYGGLGEIVRAEPDLEPLSAQLGAEYSGGHAYFGMFRPVAALDLQAREYNGWDPELAVNAGFQVESPYTVGRALRIVAEYDHGKSPNGQFFHENIEYYGFGAHFYF
jgi:hypothetical protein